jgi:hypothetical protein
MPLYTISTQPNLFGGGVTEEFEHDEAAKREANCIARDLTRNNRPMTSNERITVRGPSGLLVYEVYLIEAAMKN